MPVSGPVNVAGVLLPSASRTATTATERQDNPDAKGVLLILDFTVQAGAETLTPAVQTWDDGSNAWVTIHSAFTALSAVGGYVLAVYPAANTNIVATVGQVKNCILPRSWRVLVTHSSSGAHTYSLSYQLIA